MRYVVVAKFVRRVKMASVLVQVTLLDSRRHGQDGYKDLSDNTVKTTEALTRFSSNTLMSSIPMPE